MFKDLVAGIVFKIFYGVEVGVKFAFGRVAPTSQNKLNAAREIGYSEKSVIPKNQLFREITYSTAKIYLNQRRS